jgi:glycosyltransferase involved in cell wall biosynthesis
MSKVGIYMPAYNSEKYIGQAIESIFEQTYKNWELIIIDDCSDDSTYSVAKNKVDNTFLWKTNGDYNERYKPHVKLFKRGKHAGKIGIVKNEAIGKLSNCEYICHVGSDDYISNDCLERFVDFMESHPTIGAACGNFECFDNHGKRWSYPHVANSGEFDPEVMLSYMCMFPMRFYRRETIEAVGGYSNDLSSAVDYDLALRISEKFEIKRIQDPIMYFYRRHFHQASTKGKTEQDINAKIALQAALERRNLHMEIENDIPPFKLKHVEAQVHKIWGQK